MYLPITDKYILHSRPTSSDRPGKARCKRRAATCHGQLNLWQTTVLRRCPNQQITWVRSGLSPERWQVTLKMHLKAILIAFWKISEQWNPVFAWEVPTMQSEALHTLHKLSFPDPLCSLLCYIRMFLKSTLMSVVCIKNVNCQKKTKKNFCSQFQEGKVPKSWQDTFSHATGIPHSAQSSTKLHGDIGNS